MIRSNNSTHKKAQRVDKRAILRRLSLFERYGLPEKAVEIISIVAVCMLALFLRIWNLEWAEFKGDEAFWCFMGERILNELQDWTSALLRGKINPFIDGLLSSLVGDGLPIKGQLKQGLMQEAYGGPIVGYLVMVGFFLFGMNVVSGTLIIAILNVIGVFLTYLVGRRMYDHRVGLTAASLLATGPWLVLFSRKIWTSVNFPWLIPLLLLALWSCHKQGRGYAYFTVGISLGIATQLHLTGFGIVPPAVFFLIIYGKNLNAPNIGFLGIGVILGHLPLIIFDLKENWLNLRVYKSLITDPGSVRPVYTEGPPKHRDEVIEKLWNLIVGSGLNGKLGSGFLYGPYDLPLDIFFIVALTLSFLTIGWIVVKRLLSTKKSKHVKPNERQIDQSWNFPLFSSLFAIAFAVLYFIIRVDTEGKTTQIKLLLLFASLCLIFALFSIPLSRRIFNILITKLRKWFNDVPANDFLLFSFFGFLIYYNLYGLTGKAAGVVHIHYFNVFFPLPFLILGRGLQLAADNLRKSNLNRFPQIRYLPWLLVVLILFQNLIIVNRAFTFINDTGGEGEYGTTFDSKEKTAKFIIQHSNGNFTAFALYVRDFDAYSFIFHILEPNSVTSLWWISGGNDSASRGNYIIVERNNHRSEFDSYNSSSDYELISQIKGVYVFHD